MTQSYPFIDIATLDMVRDGFARGDAQIVLSSDMSTVLWINGLGATLFGFDTIEDVIGERLDLPAATLRQIGAFSRFDASEPKLISIRLVNGLRAQIKQLAISKISLPDGEPALLLAYPAEGDAGAIIAGLADEQTHVALLTQQGMVQACSPSFGELPLDRSVIDDLIIAAQLSDQRVVRCAIPLGNGKVPGAIARISDAPGLYLICLIVDPASLAQDESGPTPSGEIPSTTQPGFTFNPRGATARFIWHIDAQAVFRELSPAFAEAVGPHASDVIGRRFRDVATVFGFDQDGQISALLNSRDSWSSRQIFWPIDGTELHVPVELSALPVFDKDYNFDGFRGFGILNPGDAIKDPAQIGLALTGGIRSNHAGSAPSSDTLPDGDDDRALALTQPIANDDWEADHLAQLLAHKKPAANRPSAKVINLYDATDKAKPQAVPETPVSLPDVSEVVARTKGGLTDSERNAFREIADRLRRQGITSAETDTVAAFPADSAAAPTANRQPIAAETSADMAQDIIEDEVALLDSLPVPVLIQTRGRIRYVNPALLELTGYASIDEIHAVGGLEALFNSQAETTEPQQAMMLRHKSGREIAVDAHMQMIAWPIGSADSSKGVILSLMPVRKPQGETPLAQEQSDRDDNALRTQIEELKTILDTATDGVVLVDSGGRIRSMNHSASALFGYDDSQSRGKFFSMLFAIESQRTAMDYLHGLSNNGVMSILNDGREVMGREANGGAIPMFMTIGVLPHQRGYCAVLRDITQWKRTEEELTNARQVAEQASRQKTDFLARISHEIRTPLNAIIGFSELMADEKFGPIGSDRYRDYLRDINRSGTHVLTLVNDLLDISKIEAGALELKFEAVSLNDAIAEAISLMQPQANRERVIIRSSFQSNMPDIVADLRSIKQIALNLLSNAVRFTPSGGQIIISTSYELNGDVILRVRDTGIGMNNSEVEQALKPFRQINAGRDRITSGLKDWRNDGTGLGLPLTKAMVEANRADFTIQSNPGQGTVIEITFPPTRVLAD